MRLKLGILICDHLHPDLRSEFIDYPSMFGDIFNQVDPSLELQFYFVIDGIFPKNINECDGYITSGSKSSVNDNVAWINRLEYLVRELYRANIPFIGICFGHQLLAKALGGKVEKSKNGWGVGIHSSLLNVNKSWMKSKLKTIDLVVSHQDQITELPKHSQVLAASEFCPFSMIQVGETFIGVQGHPEFTNEYSAALMQLRKNIIPGEVREQGKKSFTKETNSLQITRWLIEFIRKTIVKQSREKTDAT